MTSMKAVVVDRFGGPFRVAELPVPETTAGQVLVDVEAAGLNPTDWQFADGALRELILAVVPMVIGSDAAGEGVAVGTGAAVHGTSRRIDKARSSCRQSHALTSKPPRVLEQASAGHTDGKTVVIP
jgi:NADPH:quinone reductase-like Zn-dependent oxidoreductase